MTKFAMPTAVYAVAILSVCPLVTLVDYFEAVLLIIICSCFGRFSVYLLVWNLLSLFFWATNIYPMNGLKFFRFCTILVKFFHMFAAHWQNGFFLAFNRNLTVTLMLDLIPVISCRRMDITMVGMHLSLFGYFLLVSRTTMNSTSSLKPVMVMQCQ